MIQSSILLDFEERLEELAKSKGILVTYKEGNDNDPDVASPKLRWVNMNPNFNSPYHRVFRFAHELGHVIIGDPGDETVYAFSPLGKRTAERDANSFAIDLLLNMYFDEGDYRLDRYTDFMDLFHMGYFLEPVVTKHIRQHL